MEPHKMLNLLNEVSDSRFLKKKNINDQSNAKYYVRNEII